VLSEPHFYQADPQYQHAIDGLTPNASYVTYIDVEPVSTIAISYVGNERPYCSYGTTRLYKSIYYYYKPPRHFALGLHVHHVQPSNPSSVQVCSYIAANMVSHLLSRFNIDYYMHWNWNSELQLSNSQTVGR